MTDIQETNNKSGMDGTNASQQPLTGLKRKNEDGMEEQKLEAAIKRVALDDDNNSINNNNNSNNSNNNSNNSKTSIPLDTERGKLVVNSRSGHDSSSVSHDREAVHLRMLCLVKDASLIVGPKGETISKIKNETSTRINVSANLRDVPERVIFVKGTNENVARAFGKISKCLSDKKYQISTSRHQELDSQANTDKLDENKPSNEDNSTEYMVPTTLNFLIPHHLMGYIIGKNGSRLREVEELSAAKLNASPHQLVPSNDRILKITGVPDAIHIATFYLLQTIATFKDKVRNKKSIFYQPGPIFSVLTNNHANNNNNHPHLYQRGMNPYDNINVHMNMPQQQPQHMEYRPIGENSGPSGVPMVALIPPMNTVPMNSVPPQQDPQQYSQFIPTTARNSSSSTSSLSSSSSPSLANKTLSVSVSSLKSSSDPNTMYTAETVANATSFVPNMSVPNVRIMENSINNIQPMAIVRQGIYIDTNFVGNVIGKEGKHINSIKDTTGCSITFDNHLDGETERKVTIEGTSMGVQAAIMLISNKIEMDKTNQIQAHQKRLKNHNNINNGNSQTSTTTTTNNDGTNSKK